MTKEQHPITPPPELVTQWMTSEECPDGWGNTVQWVAALAARYGADQELEACCEWVKGRDWTWTPVDLRAARRPKPPSLKQQALDLLKTDLEPGQEVASITLPAKSIDTMRQALQTLSND